MATMSSESLKLISLILAGVVLATGLGELEKLPKAKNIHDIQVLSKQALDVVKYSEGVLQKLNRPIQNEVKPFYNPPKPVYDLQAHSSLNLCRYYPEMEICDKRQDSY